MEIAARFSRVTASTAPPYRCDTDKLLAEIHRQRTGMFRDTARHPCAIRLHPADESALIVAFPLYYDAEPNSPYMKRLLSMTVIHDAKLTPGEATLERCYGCDSIGNICEHAGRKVSA
jgi:hypothetical protein